LKNKFIQTVENENNAYQIVRDRSSKIENHKHQATNLAPAPMASRITISFKRMEKKNNKIKPSGEGKNREEIVPAR
jgi:hypothetical protein